MLKGAEEGKITSGGGNRATPNVQRYFGMGGGWSDSWEVNASKATPERFKSIVPETKRTGRRQREQQMGGKQAMLSYGGAQGTGSVYI